MTNEDITVTAGEVIVTARFPKRWLLWPITGAALACGLVLSVVALAPVRHWIEANLCGTMVRCEEVLPTQQQYQSRREAELLLRMAFPVTPGRFWPADEQRLAEEQDLGEEMLRQQILAVLAEIDPWARARMQEKPAREGLLRLARVAGWGEVPQLPIPAQHTPPEHAAYVMAATRHNQELARVAKQVSEEFAWLYQVDLQALLWDDYKDQEEERAQAQRRDLVDLVASLGALVCLALAGACVAAWFWLRPVRLRVSPHHLDWNGERFVWTDIESLSWRQGEVMGVSGASRRLSPLSLSHEALQALEQATERAQERVRTLAPVDREALARVQRLRE